MQGQSLRAAGKALAMRLAHTSFLLTRPMTLGVRGLCIDAGGRVMLVKHGYVAGWHLPGGGVEVGETFHAALERELAEEANVVLEGPVALLGVYLNRHYSRRDHVAVYVARRFRVTGERAPDREIIAAEFFAPDALPPDATAGTRARLAEALAGAPVSSLW